MPLPAGWAAADLGAAYAPGGATVFALGQATLTSKVSGGLGRINLDGGSHADQLQFASAQLTGDVTLIARSQVPAPNNTPAAISGYTGEYGLMIRQSLSAADKTVAYGSAAFGADGERNFIAGVRTLNGGALGVAGFGAYLASSINWWKLTFLSGVFAAYWSADGATWSAITAGSLTPPTITGAYYAGLFMASASVNQYTQIFDSISVNGVPVSAVPTSSDPQIILRVSNDGGETFGNERPASMGKMGDYSHLVRWRRLGRSNNRVFEVVCSEPVEVALIEADLDTIA